MASYLEIKKVLKEILNLDMNIDETCDITIPLDFRSPSETNIILSNLELITAFDNMQNYSREKLELSKENYREVALKYLNSMPRNYTNIEPIVDYYNGLTYSIGPASNEYCLFILNEIAEQFKDGGLRGVGSLRGLLRIHFRQYIRVEDDSINSMEWLSNCLRLTTVKIQSTEAKEISNLRDLATSFEFDFMYKKGIAISEYADLQEMYSIGNSVVRYSRGDISSPPLRLYNKEVLDYYTMALETRDPFTMYISFYHVIEHYFDAVFRKRLTENIKEKITHPDFSYKSEEKLYELAKYIKNHMNSDDDSGKGDELKSLKYVLMEYVPIIELKNHINLMNSNAVIYYQDTAVPFIKSNKIKIAWSNPEGVYTNIAKRIYETRNALVHSKSEQSSNQYRPYRNKKELALEIPLIKSVAELVLINSSKII